MGRDCDLLAAAISAVVGYVDQQNLPYSQHLLFSFV